MPTSIAPGSSQCDSGAGAVFAAVNGVWATGVVAAADGCSTDPGDCALSAFSTLPASPLKDFPTTLAGAAVVAARAAPRPDSIIACPAAVPDMAIQSENEIG